MTVDLWRGAQDPDAASENPDCPPYEVSYRIYTEPGHQSSFVIVCGHLNRGSLIIFKAGGQLFPERSHSLERPRLKQTPSIYRNWGQLPAHQPDASLRFWSMMLPWLYKGTSWKMSLKLKLWVVNWISEVVLVLYLISLFDRMINYPCLPGTELFPGTPDFWC